MNTCKNCRKDIECKKCNIVLSNNDEYNQHMRAHSNQEGKYCTIKLKEIKKENHKFEESLMAKLCMTL